MQSWGWGKKEIKALVFFNIYIYIYYCFSIVQVISNELATGDVATFQLVPNISLNRAAQLLGERCRNQALKNSTGQMLCKEKASIPIGLAFNSWMASSGCCRSCTRPGRWPSLSNSLSLSLSLRSLPPSVCFWLWALNVKYFFRSQRAFQTLCEISSKKLFGPQIQFHSFPAKFQIFRLHTSMFGHAIDCHFPVVTTQYHSSSAPVIAKTPNVS